MRGEFSGVLPEVVFQRSAQSWILIFWDNLSNDKAIFFHLCYRIPDSWETNLRPFQNISHTCLFFTGTVYQDTIRGVILCSAALVN